MLDKLLCHTFHVECQVLENLWYNETSNVLNQSGTKSGTKKWLPREGVGSREMKEAETTVGALDVGAFESTQVCTVV